MNAMDPSPPAPKTGKPSAAPRAPGSPAARGRRALLAGSAWAAGAGSLAWGGWPAGAAARPGLPPPAAALAEPAEVLDPTPLPRSVSRALARAGVPPEALAVVVHDLDRARTTYTHRATTPMNPASLTKLLTTAAALDRLGPAWQWQTPVWLDGRIEQGVLEGNLHLRGSGDPLLVQERLWLLLRRVMQSGVREIRGDIVLDTRAFGPPEAAPGDFDGEPLRAYNAQASALLLNFGALMLRLTPDAPAGVARVAAEPTLEGWSVPERVPLAPGPCTDWQAAVGLVHEDDRTRLTGRFPTSCGERRWMAADPRPDTYAARLVGGLWREMGGRLGGQVRYGPAPEGVPPRFEHASPPLSEAVRDINKFSNNVMAQQLFLTLALQADPTQPATPAAARDVLWRWAAEKVGRWPAGSVLDNGSGLSRLTRWTAQWTAQLLVSGWRSPWMPEWVASLPVAGVDGTMRRAQGGTGRAHLKTGSLRDVNARAGFVLSDGGRRYALVTLLQHPAAGGTRPVLDAVLDWVMQDAPSRELQAP
jgi:D-alanyl-D-alanine carboxypeptidase/D-alanyl-D-alanine-endopeptidase (penicillin-binding protein 4)